MPNTFPHINELIVELHDTHDIAVAVELANAIMDVLNEGTGWEMQEPEDIYVNNVIPKRTFKNEKQQDWFCEHAIQGGERVALYHFKEAAAPYESKFYQLNKNSTKAVIAAGVMLTPNWEDGDERHNSHYKVGIDFFLNNTDDGLLMVASNKFNLRVLEFKERLTNTQIEILNNLCGLGTIKGLDASGNFVEDEAEVAQPELEPQRAIHKKLWDALALKTINKKFYAGIAHRFSLLYQNMLENGFEETASKVFATRLIGRILFCWFLAKKNIVKSLPEEYDTYEKLKVLFYDTLNTPVDERTIDDKTTPYLNGGLFEKHVDDMADENIPFPENWLCNLYAHLQEYNFTTDESSPEYQQVAIDPEMLGCVFESLLGQIDAEDGGRTQRNDTGAFYTPREIVQFMCKAALREHLHANVAENLHAQVDAILDKTDSAWLTNHSNSLRDVKDVRQSVLSALQNFKVLDPACGSGAFPMGMLQLVLKCWQRVDVDSNRTTHDVKKEILANNIFGVDINPMAAEITRLRAWLSLMVDVDTETPAQAAEIEPLPNLDFRFVSANTLIELKNSGTAAMGDALSKETDLKAIRAAYFNCTNKQMKLDLREEYHQRRQEDAAWDGERLKTLISYDPFDTTSVASFFDPQTMFGEAAFDCVIGNPPYVQIQSMQNAALKKAYKNQNFETFASTGDVYCLFYERAKSFLRAGGSCCLITSNKWMRAGYGEKLRSWLCTRVNTKTLIDLGSGVFDTATVDTNILLYVNEPPAENVSCVEAKTKDALDNLDEFITDNVSLMHFEEGESWVVLTEIEKSIKQKIESCGTPLKKWDIKINRGILTGCNEAFIIDGETKRALVAKDPKSAEILKPVLRGRDIKRFGYDFADKWLIATHNGYFEENGEQIPPVNIENYPAVKEWLDAHWEKIVHRQDQGKTPYNLRNCAYVPDFEKPKIVYSETNSLNAIKIAKDDDGFYTDKTCFIIHSENDDIDHIYEQLTSSAFNFFLRVTCPHLGEAGFSMTKEVVQQFPMLKEGKSYNFTEEEIKFLEQY